jgi:hypothetical protein
MSGAGKRAAAGPPAGSTPPAKRGNASFDDFDDEPEEMFNDDDLPEAYMPEVDDGGADAQPELGESGRNWARPPVGSLQPGCDALGALRASRGRHWLQARRAGRARF